MIIDDIKISLRISNTGYDSEILDLIEEAKADIVSRGVLTEKVVETDPLIKRAIKTYCKANFGLNNPDSERLQACYESIRNHLTMSIDYNGGVVSV